MWLNGNSGIILLVRQYNEKYGNIFGQILRNSRKMWKSNDKNFSWSQKCLGFPSNSLWKTKDVFSLLFRLSAHFDPTLVQYFIQISHNCFFARYQHIINDDLNKKKTIPFSGKVFSSELPWAMPRGPRHALKCRNQCFYYSCSSVRHHLCIKFFLAAPRITGKSRSARIRKDMTWRGFL